MVKDVKLSQAAAEATGSPTPLAALALTFYEKAMEAGDGDQGFFRGIPLAGGTEARITEGRNHGARPTERGNIQGGA